MKPLILITNDDGIYSPGLLATAEAVYDLGELLIAAPHTQQSGMGRSFPRTKELGIIDKVSLEVCNKHITGYGVHGSPAYAVAHGIMELADRKPNLCISGINYGENLGLNVNCSGTLGAAFEANSHGIPAIAASLQADLKIQRLLEYQEADWKTAQHMIRIWTKYVLDKGMQEGVDTLNINVPLESSNPETFRITSQSRQNYFEFIKPDRRMLNQPYELKSELRIDFKHLEPDSDIHALYVEHITSVTPISVKMSVKIQG